MGRLSAVIILLTIGAHRALAQDAPPQGTAKAARTPNSTVSTPASGLLRTGVRLFNKGLVDAASRCLNAAHRQQDQLSPSERIVLHDYLEEVEKYSRLLSTPKPDAGVVRTSRIAETPGAAKTSDKPGAQTTAAAVEPRADLKPTGVKGPKAYPSITQLRTPSPRPSRYAATDSKASGRWRLYEAREQIFLGNFDEAARIIDEVRAMKIAWGYFDDSPEKVTKLLDATRAKAPMKRQLPTARPLGVKSATATPKPPQAN